MDVGADEDEAGAEIRTRVDAFAEREGRRPRILVVEMSEEGQDTLARVTASAFADLGFDVDVGASSPTPAEVARHAVEHDVHAVAVSGRTAGHTTFVSQLVAALADAGGTNVRVICGGVIPPRDRAALEQAGVVAVFDPGSDLSGAAAEVLDLR